MKNQIRNVVLAKARNDLMRKVALNMASCGGCSYAEAYNAVKRLVDKESEYEKQDFYEV